MQVLGSAIRVYGSRSGTKSIFGTESGSRVQGLEFDTGRGLREEGSDFPPSGKKETNKPVRS